MTLNKVKKKQTFIQNKALYSLRHLQNKKTFRKTWPSKYPQFGKVREENS